MSANADEHSLPSKVVQSGSSRLQRGAQQLESMQPGTRNPGMHASLSMQSVASLQSCPVRLLKPSGKHMKSTSYQVQLRGSSTQSCASGSHFGRHTGLKSPSTLVVGPDALLTLGAILAQSFGAMSTLR